MAELTHQQILERAQHAKRILTDDLFTEAVRIAGQDIIGRWSAATTTEQREEAFFEQRALGHVVEVLQRIMDDAEILQNQLEKQARLEEARKQYERPQVAKY